MAYSLTQQLQSLGVPAEMGKELQRQIDANSFNAQLLMHAGWVTELAQYMAVSLTAGSFKARVATELSMIPEVANIIEGISGTFGLTNLTSWRAFKTAIALGSNVLADINAFGDSWTFAPTRYIGDVATALISQYGDGGAGWIGFGYPSAGQSQANGNARPSIYPVTFSGTWTANYLGAIYSPDYCAAQTVVSGSRIMVGFPANTATIKLLYGATFNGLDAGTARYSFDGGSAWTNFTLSGNNYGALTLTGVPSGAFTLIIESVGANACRLAGLYSTSSALKGIRINKLAGTGGKLDQYATAMANGGYRAQLAQIGSTLAQVMFGVNDQGANESKTAFAADIAAFSVGLKQVSAAQDILYYAQPETVRANLVPMKEYQDAFRESAVVNGYAFRNLQAVFGPDPAMYAFGGSNPLLAADGIHPNAAGSGLIRSDNLTILSNA